MDVIRYKLKDSLKKTCQKKFNAATAKQNCQWQNVCKNAWLNQQTMVSHDVCPLHLALIVPFNMKENETEQIGHHFHYATENVLECTKFFLFELMFTSGRCRGYNIQYRLPTILTVNKI